MVYHCEKRNNCAGYMRWIKRYANVKKTLIKDQGGRDGSRDRLCTGEVEVWRKRLVYPGPVVHG